MKKIAIAAILLIVTTGSGIAQIDAPSYKACREKLAKEIKQIDGRMMVNFIDHCMRSNG